MERIACEDAAEVSCIISNLLAELEQPCGRCGGDGVVLRGLSPLGGEVTVRLLPDHVLEVDGGEELVPRIRGSRCHREG